MYQQAVYTVHADGGTVSDEVVMKIIVTVYRSGAFRVECEGGDIDCKIASYAVQQALKLADYVATLMLITLLGSKVRESEKDKGRNTGTM
jgi:hypothetical protein